MSTLSKDDLKIAYKTINKIMEEEYLTTDNSFIRVKNWISNKLCKLIIDNE